jgi:hypothetical protein
VAASATALALTWVSILSRAPLAEFFGRNVPGWFRDLEFASYPRSLDWWSLWTIPTDILEGSIALWLIRRLSLHRVRLGTIVTILLLVYVVTPAIDVVEAPLFAMLQGRPVDSVASSVLLYFRLPDPRLFFSMKMWALMAVEGWILMRIARFGTVRHLAPAAPSTGSLYGSRSIMNATRLAAAAMIGPFNRIRRMVLEMAENEHTSPAPEPGVDTRFLLGFANYLERRAYRFRRTVFLIGVVGLVGVAMEQPAIVIVAGLASMIVAFVAVHGDRSLKGLFQVKGFSADRIRKKCWIPPHEVEYARLPREDQNLILYSGFMPFEFAGEMIGSWSVAIDVQRGREDLGTRLDPKAFGASELYEKLCGAIRNATSAEVSIADVALASGVQPEESCFNGATRLGNPIQVLPAERIGSLHGARDAKLRHYKWVRVQNPPSELIMSYFLRCSLDRKNLYVEVDRVFLGPIAAAHHGADELPPEEFGDILLQLQVSIVAGPLQSLWAVASAPFRVIRGLLEIFIRRDVAIEKAIRRNPAFNFGARQSLRSALSASVYRHYYERVDKELGQKAIDREIFNTLVDFLHEQNVDVSELREGQASVLNNGIIIQQGNLTAESVAVGERSTASVIRQRVAERVKRGFKSATTASEG